MCDLSRPIIVVDMHLPQRPADFTPAWVSAALEASGAAPRDSVESLTIKQLGMSTGFTSDLLRIIPTYRPGLSGPASIIAKMSSEDEVTSALGTSLRLFLREVHFYKELATEVGVAVPKVYFADSEEDTGRYVMLLEDMGRVGDLNPPHDSSVAEAEHVVAALAAMHAKWWGDERLKGMSWLISGTSRNYSAAVQRKYLQAWPGIVERYGDQFPAGIREIGAALGPRAQKVYDRASVPPVTLTHGSPRPQNIYIRGSAGFPEVVLISWQAVGLRPGPWDLSIFLAVGLTVEDRRSHETRLLRKYHDLLVANGIKGYPFDRVVADYRFGLLRLLILFAILDDNLVLSTPAGQGLVDRYIERSVALRDWKCGEILPL